MADKLQQATHSGVIDVNHIEIPCSVLEDGTRLLTQEGFLEAIGRASKAKGGQGASVDNTVAFLAAKNLKPFIDKGLVGSTIPIRHVTQQGRTAYGFRAEVLPEVCDVYLKARETGELHPSQEHIAKQAEIIVRGLAHVGITALVDEATGYQDVRLRSALAKIFEKYIAKEYRAWAKTFPDEFYQQIFRLNGWRHYDPRLLKRPSVVGRWTNDVVYDRLAPGILEKLKEKSPKNESGNRPIHLHRWLTEDNGVPELHGHLAGVIALMKASANWRQFQRLLERAYPKFGHNFPIEFKEMV